MQQNEISWMLPAIADLAQAAQDSQPLQEALTHAAPVILAAGSVERMTTPYMQLLLSACKAAGVSGQRLLLENPSTAVGEAFAALGLAEHYRELCGHD
jgi:anti-anti-sigma regulatory factor